MSEKKLGIKKGSADLSGGYSKRLEKSIIFSLLLFCLLFYGFPAFDDLSIDLEKPDLLIEILTPPRTELFKPPPKPKPPSIPVEAEDDEILDEVEIDFLEVQEDWLSDKPTLPVPDDTLDTFDFIAVSQKPKLIKTVAPVYPELARKSGVTGIVVVKVLIDKKGNVEKAEILKSTALLDEAAMAAAWQLKFKPGKQRDKFVNVWMSVPFHFRNPN